MVFDDALVSSQLYKVRIKDKVEQSRDGVAPSPTPQCSRYLKREPSGHPRLHVHLCGFQIPNEVKQCTTWYHTNNYDNTRHSRLATVV